MRGSVKRRCGCRDAQTGRRLGAACPRLNDHRHGSWYFVADLPGSADEQRRQIKRSGFASRREAEAALDDLRVRFTQGEILGTRMTVAQWLDEWLLNKRRLRPNSRRSYKSHVDLYLKPHLGHLALDELRVGHVAAMFDAIEEQNIEKKRPCGPSNMQRVRATLRAALSDALRQRLVTVNVAKLTELPSVRRPPPTVWTPTQVANFLAAIECDRLYGLYRLVAAVGLRRGEACGLPWENVDLDDGYVRIDRQLVDIGGRVRIGEPKSKYGERVVALDADTISALREHRRRQVEERMRVGEAWHETGYVFTRLDGHPVNPAYVSRHFTELTQQAGLPRIRLHDLRHTSASLGLAAGESLKEISERLGHSSITITADTYTRVAPVLASQSAERRAALLRPAESQTRDERRPSNDV